VPPGIEIGGRYLFEGGIQGSLDKIVEIVLPVGIADIHFPFVVQEGPETRGYRIIDNIGGNAGGISVRVNGRDDPCASVPGKGIGVGIAVIPSAEGVKFRVIRNRYQRVYHKVKPVYSRFPETLPEIE